MTTTPQEHPVSTYRLQLHAGFGFQAAAGLVDYLADLGVSHAYLSPILEPAPGSTHGYDVIDHSRLNTAAGGQVGFDGLITALHEAGLSALVDVVPNHMAVPTPVELNRTLWSVLRDGPGSPFARWFDVDWSVEHRAILMPVLGERIGDVLAGGDLVVDRTGDEPVLRYFEHVFPLRPGTEDLPLPELVDEQWYRLAWWRVGDEELNYRRFFDVDTLAAVRVEDPAVFEATHSLLLSLIASGALTGLRIDHPDGLADPGDYLRRLAEASGGVWVVVEKILEGGENLPTDWACAGTTGYDALHQVAGLFAEPASGAPLSSLLAEMAEQTPDFEEVAEQAKREVVQGTLYAEVARLVDLAADICRDDVRLRDHTQRQLHLCLIELLVAFDRYRAYVTPGEPVSRVSREAVDHACEIARSRLPEHAGATLDLLRDLVLDVPVGSPVPVPDPGGRRRAEFVVRFQQTCGPVMAKGVEDTAFYRWHRLVALNEVGGDPRILGVPPEDFHGYAAERQRDWPTTMTTLSTHDTKRSEDVRARLLAMTELVGEWSIAVREWTQASAVHRVGEGGQTWPDDATVYLMWQTLVGTWDDEALSGPAAISPERLCAYLEKATREAKVHTSWTEPAPAYDDAVASFARGVLSDESIIASVGDFCARLAEPARVAVLGQKLVQLTMPGVPDVYQGCESVDLSLVDPDNRRPVDYARRRRVLSDLDAGAAPTALSEQKLLVTSRALRLRRDRPEAFTGPRAGYTALPTTTGSAVAFARGIGEQAEAVTVVTRLPVALARRGGWGEATLALPDGRWRDVMTGEVGEGGSRRLADLLSDLPVALLRRA